MLFYSKLFPIILIFLFKNGSYYNKTVFKKYEILAEQFRSRKRINDLKYLKKKQRNSLGTDDVTECYQNFRILLYLKTKQMIKFIFRFYSHDIFLQVLHNLSSNHFSCHDNFMQTHIVFCFSVISIM